MEQTAKSSLVVLDCDDRQGVDVEKLREGLEQHGMVLVKHFGLSVERFVKLSRQLGEVLPRSSGQADHPDHSEWMKYVGYVSFRHTLKKEDRLPTQSNDTLPFHTARSFSPLRPTYFAMYMFDHGWIEEEKGHNGESLLVRFDAVIEELKHRYPDVAEEDLSILSRTSIKCQPWYVKEASDEPLLQVDEQGRWKVRYWENMVGVVREMIHELDNGQRYLEAITRFDQVLQEAAATIEFQLLTGELLFVDNRRVAHARRGFVARKGDRFNPRKMYTTWIV